VVSIPAGAFRDALADLDEAAFAAFVAHLYRATGSRARIDDGPDDTTVVVDDGTDDRRLLVYHPGPVARRIGSVPVPAPDVDGGSDAEAAGIDAVVTSVRSEGSGVVDADTLRRRTLYGVDAAERERLFDRLDRSALARTEASDTGSGAAGYGYLPGGSPTVTRGRGVVTVVAVVAVLAGLALTTGTGGPPAEDGTRFAPVEFPGVDANGTDGRGADAVGRSLPGDARRPAATAANASYPPGLSPDGIVDADRLAVAHARAVADRQYRLTLSYREFDDGVATALHRETVLVAEEAPVAVSFRRVGEVTGGTRPVAARPTGGGRTGPDAADGVAGSTRLERDPLGDGRERPYADRVERYLGWYLSVERSRVTGTFVEGDTRFFWVVLSGDPWPGVENTTGSALIDERGVVHEIRRSYDRPGTAGVSVVASIRYSFAPVGAPGDGRVDGAGDWNSSTVAGSPSAAGAGGGRTLQG